jgi:uncharacterized protein (TIGR02757 family)
MTVNKETIQLKSFLDEKAELYENLYFIENDPIQIPHHFKKKEDIEIAAFFTSIIAWGQRKTIINNARKLMSFMDDAPYDFIQHHEEEDLKVFLGFVHRTFNSDDLLYFIYRLKLIYKEEGGLEKVFTESLRLNNGNVLGAISQFKAGFFNRAHLNRTEKHLSDPNKGSSAKRINMFLRWMVRSDKKEVDFGLWKGISTSSLYLPLDVHTGNVARHFGLLERKQNDRKALEELMSKLREMDPVDPVKYDFALFGMGVNEGK